MRKAIVFIVLLLLVFSMSAAAQAAPRVILDDRALTFDVPPVIENDRTLVPLRAIFEALGAGVQWNGDTQTVTATKTGTEISLTIGVQQAFKNSQPVNLDVPAKIINDRTMVPLRFVSESMGAAVNWNGDIETIYIASPGSPTKVHIIDVGQADAIYCQLPAHYDILIDAGNKADGQTVVNYLRSQGVDNLELVIATHPHEDHIGGLPAVLAAFKAQKIIDSSAVAESAIYKEYAADVAAEGAVYQADNHQEFAFGNDTLQILTGPEHWKDINDYSVVCRLDTGDIEFLFTGDAEGPAEAALSGVLDADILKVGHHGSQTSSSPEFLRKVSPRAVVISVGAGNNYGHPAPETIQRLQNSGATVYRTDMQGNIIVSTDGKTYSIQTVREAPVETPAPVQQYQPEPQPQTEPPTAPATSGVYIGSIKSDKYHYPECRYAQKISLENQIWFQTEEDAQAAGYEPCGVCKP